MSGSANQLNEAQLVVRLRRGDKKAVEELFSAYFDRLYSLVFYEVGRDRSAAEDVTQETFLSALKSVKSYRKQSHPYTWLVGIAHHKIADYYRRRKKASRRGEEPLTSETMDVEQIRDSRTAIVDIIESAEMRAVVEQALSNLPLDYRQVLLLKYVEEMSVLEISQIMGRSPKSVEGLLSRARKALRANLSTQDKG